MSRYPVYTLLPTLSTEGRTFRSSKSSKRIRAAGASSHRDSVKRSEEREVEEEEEEEAHPNRVSSLRSTGWE